MYCACLFCFSVVQLPRQNRQVSSKTELHPGHGNLMAMLRAQSVHWMNEREDIGCADNVSDNEYDEYHK